MKFIVTKTSVYSDDAPCDEAKSGMFESWSIRYCTEAYFNKRFAEIEGLWRSKGRNHCVNSDGNICRQAHDERLWYIEIGTLDELMDFCSKHGQIVVSSNKHSDRDGEIEIYDDYRE